VVNLRLTTAQSYALALLIATLVFSACAGNEPKASDIASPTPVITVMGEEASAETLARGAELYAANCQSCHGGATGGSLKAIPPPHNANGHTWHHADQQLMNMVLNDISFSLEEQKMPAFRGKLTEEEVKAILAYIKTWWTEEQRQSQKEVTRQWNQ
jgi:mono/diheme cytochrome c family protein